MKKAKVISTLTTTLMLIFALTTVVAASGTNIAGVVVNPNTTGATGITNVGNRIVGIIQVVGTLIAVGMVLILGIKYMAGSAEEKAANKKSMVPYLIGAALLFVGANLVKAIYIWTSTININ